jgi:hypothetical protein
VAPVTGILRSDPFVPDSITAPHFYVGELAEQYDQTFGGMVDAEVICRVLVSRSDAPASQSMLRSFMRRTGPTSVKAAIEANPTLSGACDDLQVRRMQGHHLYKVGENTFYGAEWVVHVIGMQQ